MKNYTILLSVFFASCSISHAQSEKITLNETYFGKIKTAINLMVVDNDTTQFYSIFFSNMEYEHITDLKSIHIYEKEKFEDFKSLVTDAVTWDKTKKLSDVSGGIYLSNNKNKYYMSYDGGHVYLFKSNLNGIHEELNTIDTRYFK